MNSRIIPSKEMRRCNEEHMYAYALRACETNNAFMLIALNQAFNFGAVRLQKLIEKYNEVSLMYRDHIRDGFSDEECNQIIRNALVDIGLDPSQVFSNIERNAFRTLKQESRKFEKNNVPTYSEAEKAVENMKAFRAAINSQEQKIV
ncbi:MAG: hypothetical protein UIH27_08715 [Ruminococcus sp.]|nr:hypothetical protein [Ruminococcus sp.]